MRRSEDNLDIRKRLPAAVGLVLFGLISAHQIRAQATPTTTVPLPSFEVASIKRTKSGGSRGVYSFQPARFIATGVTTKWLITAAYGVYDFQVYGGPNWVGSEEYDIRAKADDSIIEELQELPPSQRSKQVELMLESLFAERFKLQVNRETKELPVYALVVAKGGPKLHEATPPNETKNPDSPGMMRAGPGELTCQRLPVTALLPMLSSLLGRPVLDHTGLKGKYDFTFRWETDSSQRATFLGPAGNPQANSAPPSDSGPSIFTALQEQLGLKLESTKGPVDVIVIGHIERPSED
jgi:uncharacterized protein (TIGR03435 family)